MRARPRCMRWLLLLVVASGLHLYAMGDSGGRICNAASSDSIMENYKLLRSAVKSPDYDAALQSNVQKCTQWYSKVQSRVFFLERHGDTGTSCLNAARLIGDEGADAALGMITLGIGSAAAWLTFASDCGKIFREDWDFCKSVFVEGTEEAHGTNLVVPDFDFAMKSEIGTPDFQHGYVLVPQFTSQSLMFTSSSDGKSTIWTNLVFQPLSQFSPACKTWSSGMLKQPAGGCESVAYFMPDAFFKGGIGFYNDKKAGIGVLEDVGVRSTQIRLTDNVKSRIAVVSKGGTVYGLQTSGCALPKVKVRIYYEEISQDPDDTKGTWDKKSSPYGDLSIDDVLSTQSGFAGAPSLSETDLTREYLGFSKAKTENLAPADLAAAQKKADALRPLLASSDFDANAYWNQANAGRRRLLSTSKEQCLRRVVELYEVEEDAAEACHLDIAPREAVSLVMKKSEAVYQAMKDQKQYTGAVEILAGVGYEYRYASYSSGDVLQMNRLHLTTLLQCGMLPGSWNKNNDINMPGKCAECPYNDKTKNRRPCTPADPLTQECCYECKPKFDAIVDESSGALICAPKCVKGKNYYHLSVGGACVLCETGKVQNPAKTTECMPCPGNTYASKEGCQSCGPLAESNPKIAKARCDACAPNARYDAGIDECAACPLGSTLEETSAGAWSCAACAPGTYHADPTAERCELCPQNEYSGGGASACSKCPAGKHTLGRGHSTCDACAWAPLLNHTLVRWRADPGVGCAYECVPGMAYLKSNAAIEGGCVPCADKLVPPGMFRDKDNCIVNKPCTALTDPNRMFTSAGDVGVDNCKSACKPGFYESGTKCVACTAADAAQFNATRHRYVISPRCNFECLPLRYFTDADKVECPPCLDAAAAEVVYGLRERVREYNGTASSRALSFPSGFWSCGAPGVTDPTSRLSVLRSKGRYFPPPAKMRAAGTCGDSMLQAGEECDDGNAAGGDGCSAACKLERYSRYDCDLIGQPCLPRCGWDGGAKGTQDYILPNVSACEGHSFYEYSNLVTRGGRGDWLAKNMVSCVCAETSRQLPFGECNLQNKGCRVCPNRTYYGDAYECRECGSRCRRGFQSANTPECGPSVRTREQGAIDERLLEAALRDTYADTQSEYLKLKQQQAEVGCVPCTVPSGSWRYQMEFTGGGCAFRCRQSLFQTADPDATAVAATGKGFYCSLPLNSAGECPGRCLTCACDGDQFCRGRTTAVGKYYGVCADGAGVALQNCSTRFLPSGSEFASGGEYGAADSCSWQCRAGWQKDDNGQCHECLPLPGLRCPSGFKGVACDARTTTYYCRSCYKERAADALEANEAWYTSASDVRECVRDCAVGAWRSPLTGLCEACTGRVCELGERLTVCNRTHDSACVGCPALLPNTEWTGGSNCETRCVAGRYFTGHSCETCDIYYTCGFNATLAHQCEAPAQRLAPPPCVPCEPLRDEGSYLTSLAGHCTFGCLTEFELVASNYSSSTTPPGLAPLLPADRGCAPCNHSRCPLGTRGSCADGVLLCGSCAIEPGLNERYLDPGNCAIGCKEGTALDRNFQCASTAGTLPKPGTRSDAAAVAYVRPNRTKTHREASVLGGLF